MTRILAIAALVVAVLVAVVVLAASSGGGGEGYKVRAIFDNAGFVIPGEDVKVAGVKVGRIDALDVTRDFKAVVVLDIQDEAYQDFREDAECMVRPQSLIGERYVECEPTQKRTAGAPLPPPLEEIRRGPGKGQRLLPVENTAKPVDLDLINNITREPERARLSIILNELGTGVAGRGRDLNDGHPPRQPGAQGGRPRARSCWRPSAARSSSWPATATPCWRRWRASAATSPRRSRTRARWRRRRRSAATISAADIERLPRFLRELRPTMVRLGALSDEMTPVLTDLGDVAPDINRLLIELGPFARAAIPAFDTLGDVSRVGIPALTDARPVIRDLRRFAGAVRPVGSTLAAVLESLQKTRGLERALDYVFYQVAAINGFDSFGHYLRAGLIVNQCSVYSVEPTAGCSANFTEDASSSASTAAASGAPADPVLAQTREALTAALRGEKAPKLQATPTPAPAPAPKSEPAPDAPAGKPVKAPPGAEPVAQPDTADDPLLDYLFGKDSG